MSVSRERSELQIVVGQEGRKAHVGRHPDPPSGMLQAEGERVTRKVGKEQAGVGRCLKKAAIMVRR